MCAYEAQNEHVREEDKCIVAKVIISSSEVKAELLNFMNLQFMQFNLQILGDALKIDQAITQMETISVDGKSGDSRKETIHILCSHNSSTLKILWKCLRFDHIELNIRENQEAFSVDRFIIIVEIVSCHHDLNQEWMWPVRPFKLENILDSPITEYVKQQWVWRVWQTRFWYFQRTVSELMLKTGFEMHWPQLQKGCQPQCSTPKASVWCLAHSAICTAVSVWLNSIKVVVFSFSFSGLVKLSSESCSSSTQSLSEVVWLISALKNPASLKSVSEVELPDITGLKVWVICMWGCKSQFPCSVNVEKIAKLRGCAGPGRSEELGMRERSEEVMERSSSGWLTKGESFSKLGDERTDVAGMISESWMNRFSMLCSTAWKLIWLGGEMMKLSWLASLACVRDWCVICWADGVNNAEVHRISEGLLMVRTE